MSHDPRPRCWSRLSLVSSELGKIFEELRREMLSNKGADSSSTSRADVRLVKGESSEAKVRSFTLFQDEPASVWGTGRGLTPIDYFIASVGFGENVIFARNASMASLTIETLETSVTGPGTDEASSTSTESHPTSRPSRSKQGLQQETRPESC